MVSLARLGEIFVCSDVVTLDVVRLQEVLAEEELGVGVPSVSQSADYRGIIRVSPRAGNVDFHGVINYSMSTPPLPQPPSEVLRRSRSWRMMLSCVVLE